MWEHDHSTTVTESKVRKGHKTSGRHTKDPKPNHSMTPSGSRVKEEPETSHGQKEKRTSSPQTKIKANTKERLIDAYAVPIKSWFSLWGVIQSVLWIASLLLCFSILLKFALSQKASVSNTQPHSSLRNVLQSHDLIVSKSHSDTVFVALNRLTSGPTLDNAGNEISINESPVAVLGITSKFTRGIQQVDLLGSFIGRQLSPAIKTNVRTGNCSLLALTQPIAQTAQTHFRDTLDSLNAILSSHDHAVSALKVSRFGVQQALNNADKELRTGFGLWSQKSDKESGDEKNRHVAEMETWRDVLDDAIERLLIGREIVNLKVNIYGGSSADFDILVEELDRMAGTEGLIESRCGVSEAEVVERLFKVTVSKAADDVEGTQSFEEYFNAI